MDALLASAADKFRQRWPRVARHGIILGTGAGELANEIQTELELPYGELAGFPKSTAMGHRGQFVAGLLAETPVIAMQGRFHRYEGYSRQQAALPVQLMHRLGVEVLLISNASGGIHPQYCSGDLMAIDSHLDLMSRPGDLTRSGAGRGARGDGYDAELIELAQQVGRRSGFLVHRGCYGGMLGPNYETRAEYRFLRRVGADVAGMSTIPEVQAAAELGIRTLGISVVANVANPDALQETSGQDVIDAAQVAAPRLKTIALELMRSS